MVNSSFDVLEAEARCIDAQGLVLSVVEINHFRTDMTFDVFLSVGADAPTICPAKRRVELIVAVNICAECANRESEERNELNHCDGWCVLFKISLLAYVD